MDNNITLLAIGTAVFLLSLIFVKIFCHYAHAFGLLDIPNARSSHQISTPRGGGIVFVLLWLFGMTLGFKMNLISKEHWIILVPAATVASFLGFWDDYKTISAKIRLFIQFLIASSCIMLLDGMPILHVFGSPLMLGIFGTLFGIFSIIWSINLFNFMDGTDGIAGFEATFVLGLGGLFFYWRGILELAIIAWLMVLAVAGFLIWNWPKARIFMGDAGSYCLGFLIVMLSLIGDYIYHIPIGLWFILYSVFWFDTTITLIRRIFLKKHWASAHRDHAYQRLLQANLSHRDILRITLALNAIMGIIAIWSFYHLEWLKYSLILTILLLSGYYIIVERLKPLSKETA